jgi:hypothetical protein
MNDIIDVALAQQLRSDIAKYIKAGGGSESISFIHRSLRDDGWSKLGKLYQFEALCERFGFVVRDGVNNRGQHRTEVAFSNEEN